jgi:hypothetical protein
MNDEDTKAIETPAGAAAALSAGLSLIADLRSRINPTYAATLGTESYERRLCVEALESQAREIQAWRDAADKCGCSTPEELKDRIFSLGECLPMILRTPNAAVKPRRHED